MKISIKGIFFLVFVILFTQIAKTQPNTTIDLEKEKSEKYKERKLPAEKTGEKKFKFHKRILNNIYTRYNYHFNAKEKLKEVLVKAKQGFTDNYDSLLPFYNYTLTQTEKDRIELDSIIYKCTAGILLHDLRTDWVDDMYLVLGKALMFRKDFDSAHQVFSYLNYVYADKDGEYDLPIGSNESPTDGVFTVVTNEQKRSILKKIFKRPTARNDALLWMVRNYIEQGNTDKATGLLNVLQIDPLFPSRLKLQLNELVAYNYYKQGINDSAAAYLIKALPNAENRAERSRWHYLIGQLLVSSGKNYEAIEHFNKAVAVTQDPLVEIYSRLNAVLAIPQTVGFHTDSVYKQHAAELYKLSKKESFESSRDVLYYISGNINAKNNDWKNAANDFYKSLQYTTNNNNQKQKTIAALANAYYNSQQFQLSKNYYDSLDVNSINADDKALIAVRKKSLVVITESDKNIQLQDSLKLLSTLPQKEITAIIKRTYKQLKKQYGHKDAAQEISFGNEQMLGDLPTNNLMLNTQDSKEHYFANSSARQQGVRDFKTKWGNRPNVDNWNRSAVASFLAVNQQATGVITTKPEDTKDNDPMANITPESMYLNIPFTTEKKQIADSIILSSYAKNIHQFAFVLDEYNLALALIDTVNRRFLKNKFDEQHLFTQMYCYEKLDQRELAHTTRIRLKESYPNTTLLSQGRNTEAIGEEKNATALYKNIYDKFLEGRFNEARADKLAADNVFGKKYWTPQLLFIESMYYIKNREDSIAIVTLRNLKASTKEPFFVDKANNMIDVLSRRKEIETYLSNLKIDSTSTAIVEEKPIDVTPIEETPTPPTKPVEVKPVAKDTVKAIVAKPVEVKPVTKDTVKAIVAKPVEVKPVAKDTVKAIVAKPVEVKPVAKDTVKAIVAKPVEVKPVAKDTVKAIVAKPVEVKDTNQVIAAKPVVDIPTVKDTVVAKPAPVSVSDQTFTYNETNKHYVAVLLNKVDNMFANEVKNALNKYNKQKYYNLIINQSIEKVDADNTVLLQSGFDDAATALAYINAIKLQASRMLSWLTPDKYSFILVDEANYKIIKQTNNLSGYINFIKTVLPGKF